MITIFRIDALDGRRARRPAGTCRGGRRNWRCGRCGGGRWRLPRSFNWICRRRLLRRQIAKCKLHRTLDRDVRDAFALVDPGVGIQVLGRGLADGLQFFLTRFGAFLFVSVAMRCGRHQHEHENSKKKKEQNDAEPCSKGNRRAFWYLRCNGNGHFQFLKRNDSIRRGSRTGKVDVFPISRR